MSRQLIETESPRWVAAGLITPAQRQQLLDFYPPEAAPAVGVLPLLGGILLSLGVLSLVAANWPALPEVLRLFLLVAAVGGAYAGAAVALRRGHEALGTGLLGVGLVTFGAGIALVGQMYHLVSYNAYALLVWGAAGVALTWLYGSRLLFLLALLILGGVQWYSTAQFGQYSYAALALFVGGLGGFWFRRPDRLLGWGLALGWLAQVGLLVNAQAWPGIWLLWLLLALYAAADWLPRPAATSAGEPAAPATAPVQILPLAAAFLVAATVGATKEGNWLYRELTEAGWAYPAALLGLFGVSAAGKARRQDLRSLLDWVLLVPVFYLPPGFLVSVLQLLLLYAFAGAVLWRGYQSHARRLVNMGTLVFIATSALAYFRLTWEFLDKSVFFIVGGVLLLALSWWLQRRAARALAAPAAAA